MKKESNSPQFVALILSRWGRLNLLGLGILNLGLSGFWFLQTDYSLLGWINAGAALFALIVFGITRSAPSA